jgi:methylmalonyl-CoA carboxyltransferase large subunit
MVFAREIAEAADPQAKRAEMITAYRDTFATPFMPASRGLVDDIIDPALTRAKGAFTLEQLAGKRKLRPAKKHGVFPS